MALPIGVAPSPPLSLAIPSGNGSFWIGSDGNVWVKGANGVNSAGKADANSASYWSDRGYGQIPDPLPGGHTLAASTLTPNNTGGGGGSTLPPLDTAGISNTQKTIDQIPALLQAALAAEAQNHANTVGGFDASQATEQGNHDTGTVTNQQNYDSNFMDSIRAGIKGLGGLMALLRGTGAGGGTAEDLARDAVGGTTANDISTGATTQKENQGQLDSSLASFLTDLKTKRAAAEDTFTNNNRAIQRDSNTQLQDLYGKVAGFYGASGDTADANNWTNKAGDLTPSIAADSKTQVSPYDTTPVVIHAPNLTAFNGPTQPSVVAPPSDGQVGSGIFTMDPGRKKSTTPTPSLVPAGA